MRPCKEHDDLGCPMTRINRVNGSGSLPCDIMLIGEAPGKTEDKSGRPFCGKSGSELDKLYLWKCAHISRKSVYVTNLVKCRTNEKDRDPTVEEIKTCSHLLIAEFQTVKPRFVGAVGKWVTQWLLKDAVKMDKVHGFAYHFHTGDALMMSLYHPAFGLHNTAMIRHIMDDWTRFGKMVRGDESVMWRAR